MTANPSDIPHITLDPDWDPSDHLDELPDWYSKPPNVPDMTRALCEAILEYNKVQVPFIAHSGTQSTLYHRMVELARTTLYKLGVPK